jgi:hypothetical protein
LASAIASVKLSRHWIDSDMKVASLFFQKGFSVLGGLNDAALAGAASPLSAARFPQVAAAGAEISDFQPVVAKKQMNFGGPG